MSIQDEEQQIGNCDEQCDDTDRDAQAECLLVERDTDIEDIDAIEQECKQRNDPLDEQRSIVEDRERPAHKEATAQEP